MLPEPAPNRARRLLLVCVLLASALNCGCNLFKPLAFMLPAPKETIPAEFAHLDDSVTVLVWAHPETLYDYPNVRLELASHVVDQMAANLDPELEIAYADVLAVEDHLERSGARFIDPEQVGRQFDTRFVVYLELLEFALRDPQMPDFLQGRMRSSLSIYDLDDEPARAYDLGQVETTVPPSAVRFTQSNVLIIRKGLYVTFAGQVAKKFYDHEEVIE